MLQLTVVQARRAPRRSPPFFKTKKLAIIGCTLSRQYAPWHDPSWTIVTHCSARPFCKREPDWYMDLHPPSCFRREQKGWHPSYYSWLKSLQTPIFMQESWPDIPMAVRYPIERILGEFRAYFTNHCAYMIALAMTEGVTHIGLYGCQYGSGTEYAVQRGSLEYWCGRFEEHGGQVILPSKYSDLLNSPSKLYGYESHDLETGKLVPEYKRPLAVPKGDVRLGDGRVLTVLDNLPHDQWPPLMPPPDGQAIRSW